MRPVAAGPSGDATRNIIVWMPRRLRSVPRAAIWVDSRIGGPGQCTMSLTTSFGRCGTVDGRPDQGMPKNNVRRHLQEAVGLNSGGGGLIHAEKISRAPDRSRVTRWLGGGDEEQLDVDRTVLEVAVFELMARVPHPDAAGVLTAIGKHHPDKKIAKLARKSAYKAATLQAARRQ